MVPIMAKRELDEMALAQPSNGLHKAVQVLRDLIVMGHLAPGSRLTEAELAERLHLSRTPIRGALLWLQREGYVLAAPGKVKTRIMVAPLTHGDASEIYAIIGRLEGLAARNAAQLPDAKRAALVKRLAATNQQLMRLASGGDRTPGRFFELDKQFHSLIVEAGSGPRLKAMHKAIQPLTERYWRLYMSAILDQLSNSTAEHQQILQGLTRGDAAAAERAMQSNWENGADRLYGVIQSWGERGSWELPKYSIT